MENEYGKLYTQVFTSRKGFYKPKSLHRCDYLNFISTRTWKDHFAKKGKKQWLHVYAGYECGDVAQYLILMALLINGDSEFGNVCDELIAFGFPECFHTDLEMFDQDFLKRGRKGITNLFLYV